MRIQDNVYYDSENAVSLEGIFRVFHDGTKDPANHRWFVDISLANYDLGIVEVRIWFDRKTEAISSFVTIMNHIARAKKEEEEHVPPTGFFSLPSAP